MNKRMNTVLSRRQADAFKEQFSERRPSMPTKPDLRVVPSQPEPKRDLRRVQPVNEETMMKPGSRKTRRDANIRADYTESLLNNNPKLTNEEVVLAVRNEYGVGIAFKTITGIRQKLSIAGIGVRVGTGHRAARRDQRQQRDVQRQGYVQVRGSEDRAEVVGPPATTAHAVKSYSYDTDNDKIRSLVELLVEEVLNLVNLKVAIGDDGKVEVCEYKLRAVTHGKVEF